MNIIFLVGILRHTRDAPKKKKKKRNQSLMRVKAELESRASWPGAKSNSMSSQVLKLELRGSSMCFNDRVLGVEIITRTRVEHFVSSTH